MTPRKKNKKHRYISSGTIPPYSDRNNSPTSDQSTRIPQPSSTTSSSSTGASSTGQPPTISGSSSQHALISATSDTTSQPIHPLPATNQGIIHQSNPPEHTSSSPSHQDTPSTTNIMAQETTNPLQQTYGFRDPFTKLNNRNSTVKLVISIVRRASQTGKQGAYFLSELRANISVHLITFP